MRRLIAWWRRRRRKIKLLRQAAEQLDLARWCFGPGQNAAATFGETRHEVWRRGVRHYQSYRDLKQEADRL